MATQTVAHRVKACHAEGMYLTGRWTLYVTAGGWVKCVDDSSERAVYLQLRPSDRDPAQLSTHTAVMQSDKPISVHAWSQVPFAQIEMLVGNNPDARALVDSEHGHDPAAGFEEYFAAHPYPQKTVRLSWSEVTPNVPEPGDRPAPLQRPQRITDDFLKDVAAQYRWVSASGELPGPAMAEQTGAPVRTVQRWVYEARKRGFLPPGRPGRAG